MVTKLLYTKTPVQALNLFTVGHAGLMVYQKYIHVVRCSLAPNVATLKNWVGLDEASKVYFNTPDRCMPYCFESSVWVIWEPSWLLHFELIQHEEGVQVSQLQSGGRSSLMGGTSYKPRPSPTSCLPTLLLTRAPTPSACSTDNTFFTIALAVLLIVSALPNFQ